MKKVNSVATFCIASYALVVLSCQQPLQDTESAETAAVTVSSDGFDRTVLPIKETYYAAQTELDARNAKPPARFEVKAPEKAPNVVIVLIDDIGFGHSSAFGGPIHMPTLEKLLM